MKPSRRSLLRTLSSGLSVGFTGCVQSQSQQFDPTDHVEDWHDDSVAAQGEPITVEECRREATDPVKSAVIQRSDATYPEIMVDYGKTAERPDPFIEVNRMLIINANHEIQQSPDVSFEAVLNAAPATLTRQVNNSDREYPCPDEVYVSDWLLQTAP